MNKIKSKITKITSHEGVSLVNMSLCGTTFGTVVLDTPESCSYLKIDKDITVAFKETEVAIGLENLGDISMANQLPCTIKSLQNGKILAKIELTCKDETITSLITTNSSKRPNLEEGKNVIALIKANEISLIDESK